jgi:hypothetical protein
VGYVKLRVEGEGEEWCLLIFKEIFEIGFPSTFTYLFLSYITSSIAFAPRLKLPKLNIQMTKTKKLNLGNWYKSVPFYMKKQRRDSLESQKHRQ